MKAELDPGHNDPKRKNLAYQANELQFDLLARGEHTGSLLSKRLAPRAVTAKSNRVFKWGQMSIVQIEHVQLAMPTGREDDARRFYSLGLGLAEVRKPENLAARGGCWFELDNVRVHLGIDTDFRPAKKAHPAFVVTDLDALCERLDGLGYMLTDDQPLKGFRRTYVADPFGNRIELMEPVETD